MSFAGDLGRHPLEDLAPGGAVLEQGDVGMRVDVDEPRGDDQSPRLDRAPGGDGAIDPADRRDPACLLLVQEPDPGAPAEGSLAGGPAGGAGPAQGARAITGAAAVAGAAGAAATDEVHHRLADGTLLHVSVWLHEAPAAGGSGAASPSVVADDPGRDPGVIAVPYARGWTQVLVGATRQ